MGLTIGFDATAAVHQAAGIGRYTRDLMGALAKQQDGNQYRVFYCSRGVRSGGLPPLDGRFRVRPLPLSDRVVNAVWYRFRLPIPIAALTGKFEVFHSPDFVLPPALNVPGVVTIHDLAFLRVPDCAYPTLREYLRRVVPECARRASMVIAVSESTRRDVIELLGIPEERVTVIFEGVGKRFRPLDTACLSESLRAMRLERSSYILAVGTLEPRKNYVRLLEAYAYLRSKGVEHDLVIAGTLGWLYEPILRRISELGLDRFVRLVHPSDEDLVVLYNGTAAFVYPSLYEGFGLPPLEALACGASVACSNTSSMPEVIGEAGVTFDPLDTGAIAESLLSLLSQSALRARLKTLGPQQAASFTWEHAAQQTTDVYARVADGG